MSKHSLTEKDRAALVATCSACGPATPIAKNGKYGYVCREARREARRRYRAAHPDRVRHQPSSQHRLTNRDGSADTCAVCGPVTPVVMGRGWGCPTRAKELGWKTFDLEPQPRCPVCRTWLDRFGGCAKCEDDLADLEEIVPAESYLARRRFKSVREWLDNGYTIQDEGLNLPEFETAVRGWKTIGSYEPIHGVRPEYAALYGAGSK